MSEKQVTIIFIVLLVLIVLGGGAGIYYLWFDVLPAKEAELAKVSAEVDDALKKQREIPGLVKDIESLKIEEKEKLKHIPNMTKAEYDEFAVRLDELRRKSGVHIPRATWVTATKPAPVTGRPPRASPTTMHRVQYDLAVEGGFYQLLRFINLLEEERRFINVESFSILPGGSNVKDKTARGPQAYKRDLKIIIYSYTYKLPEEKSAPVLPEHRFGESTPPP